MKASIIIPCRNMAALLDNTLSALKDDCEIIVVDDDSTDNTKEIAEKFSVNYVRVSRTSAKKRRVAEIRNHGAKLAKNEYIIFLDADTIPSKNFVQEHMNALKTADVIIGQIQFMDKGGKLSEDPRVLKGPEWTWLYSGNFSVKKSKFFQVGGFSTYFDSWGVEDQELGYKLSKSKAKIVYNHRASAVHQFHETEYKSNLEQRISIIKNATKFYNKYKDMEIARFYNIDKKKLQVKLFDKCNNNCTFCDRVGRKGENLSVQRISKMLDNIGTDWKLNIMGGEPTIRQDFFEILNILKQKGFKYSLTTNGRAFSYISFCEKCINHNISEYTVFVYAHNEVLHEKLTGEKGFLQTVKGIQNLLNLNQKIALNLIISQENYQEFEEIVDFYMNISKIPFNITLVDNVSEKILPMVKKYIDNGFIINNPFYECYTEGKQASLGCANCIAENCDYK